MTKFLTLMVDLLFSTGLLFVAKQDSTGNPVLGVLLKEGYSTKSIKCQDEMRLRDRDKRAPMPQNGCGVRLLPACG
jgi:hypothetical protein